MDNQEILQRLSSIESKQNEFSHKLELFIAKVEAYEKSHEADHKLISGHTSRLDSALRSIMAFIAGVCIIGSVVGLYVALGGA